VTTKIIVSYDGTDNDRDALALGKVLAATGASVALAYVRHAVEGKRSAERLAERDAQELLDAGAEALGGLGVTTHVVLSASTPNGLRDLALELDAGAIVFGSEYRTAPGHVDPQASARRLLDGGPIAVALAPSGFHALTGYAVGTVGVVAEDGDPCVLETAETIAARHHGTVASRATGSADLLVVGSKPGTVNGRVTLSAAADYLIELTRCPVLVLPRGVAVAF
jgi:nucleotide-binding universal stress UspA family protein